MGINNCTCKSCGRENKNGDVFCRYCGEPLPSKGEIQKRQEKQKKQLSIKYSFNFPRNYFRSINCAICNRLYE